MDAMVTNGSMLALFSLGGGEIILILALIVILLGARQLPGLPRGLGQGIYQFRKASGDLAKALDQEAADAGQGLAGIYGKPAAEALTPHNQTAELYDPEVFREKDRREVGPRPWYAAIGAAIAVIVSWLVRCIPPFHR